MLSPTLSAALYGVKWIHVSGKAVEIRFAVDSIDQRTENEIFSEGSYKILFQLNFYYL